MDPEWILNTSLSQGTSSSSSGSVLFICVFVQVFHCRVSERRCLTSHVIPCHPGPLASSRWGRWDIARVARGLVHPVAPHRLFSFNSFEHASSIQFNCLSLSLSAFVSVCSVCFMGHLWDRSPTSWLPGHDAMVRLAHMYPLSPLRLAPRAAREPGACRAPVHRPVARAAAPVAASRGRVRPGGTPFGGSTGAGGHSRRRASDHWTVVDQSRYGVGGVH